MRLPKPLLAEAGLSLGQEIELLSVPEGILLRPARPVFDIDELVAGMTDDNRHDPIDAPPLGREVLDD